MKFVIMGLAAMAVWVMASLPTVILAQNHFSYNQETLVMVNGSPITGLHLDKERRLLNAAMALDLLEALNALDGVSDADLLEHLIDRELILQQAVANQIKVHKRHVNDAMETFKSSFNDSTAYEQYLLNIDMTETQLTEHLRTGLMIKRFIQNEVIHRVRVSDAELNAFYSRYPEDFIRPTQVRALHLMVAVADEDQRADALIKIQEIQIKLAQGADFGVTALENSDCPSRANGGDLGYFTYQQVIAPVAEVAFFLQPGQISQIVQSSMGYHLVKAIDRKPPSRIAFKDMRDKIERTIRRNKENRAMAGYLDGLRKEAEIIRYSKVP